ncbi:MAG: NADH:ubiquinone oxidoreductase subunit N, partial [Burkholderia sp.]
VKLMYFDAPQDTNPIMSDATNRAVLLFNGVAVVVLGLAPGRLMEICLQAISHTLPL